MPVLKKTANILSLLVFAVFLLVRYGFESQILVRFGEFGTYYVEAAFILFCLIQYRKSFTQTLKIKLSDFKRILVSIFALFGLGVLTIRGISLFGLLNPFSVHTVNTTLTLLIFAPIFEEYLFRFAYWEMFSRYLKRPAGRVIVSALLFSLAHFYSWFLFDEPELKSFILYQSAYVFLLGLWIGFERERTKSILIAIACHFGFNFGFYLASL